tara:strand:- start:5808 stop:5987 length:180 start_codon:yes stop_codon:yes gene_type:complete
MNYIVELREYTDCGDYIENDYEFETKSEALKFAHENKGDVYAILEYQDEKNYDPKHLSL